MANGPWFHFPQAADVNASAYRLRGRLGRYGYLCSAYDSLLISSFINFAYLLCSKMLNLRITNAFFQYVEFRLPLLSLSHASHKPLSHPSIILSIPMTVFLSLFFLISYSNLDPDPILLTSLKARDAGSSIPPMNVIITSPPADPDPYIRSAEMLDAFKPPPNKLEPLFSRYGPGNGTRYEDAIHRRCWRFVPWIIKRQWYGREIGV